MQRNKAAMSPPQVVATLPPGRALMGPQGGACPRGHRVRERSRLDDPTLGAQGEHDELGVERGVHGDLGYPPAVAARMEAWDLHPPRGDPAEDRRASQILADGIPGARLAVMADCAHVPPLEEPVAFAELLCSFIATCSRAAP
jgi:pimeloyl-ACP methyl ester carboxylesterase